MNNNNVSKLSEVLTVEEYYLKKINNEYVFIFDKLSSVDFLKNTILSGFYMEGNSLTIYLETELAIKTITFNDLESRSVFLLKRLSKLSFIEHDDVPFSYEVPKIKKPL